ncbi:hypothetical protein B484DRAFT_406439 [Ochromonadaceae sp. CCMP2298]|nr:hypothetical protein B484DRAFT_406439 [Ochromonadaceae sp. CCMP2298]
MVSAVVLQFSECRVLLAREQVAGVGATPGTAELFQHLVDNGTQTPNGELWTLTKVVQLEAMITGLTALFPNATQLGGRTAQQAFKRMTSADDLGLVTVIRQCVGAGAQGRGQGHRGRGRGRGSGTGEGPGAQGQGQGHGQGQLACILRNVP